MKIRMTALIFSVAMLAVLLTGCGCEHEWVEATCLTPKTCNLCQKTEGETLGHVWKDADYQTPKTCSMCGTTEGDPLIPDFEKYGLSCNVLEGYKYPFVVRCLSNTMEKTEGYLIVKNYQVFESDETHLAKDGYEWRSIDCYTNFRDQNSHDYSIGYSSFITNYYNIESWQTTCNNNITEQNDNGFFEYVSEHVVTHNGEDYYVTCIAQTALNGTKHGDYYKFGESISYWKYYVQVPIGYDGIVLVFCDSYIDWKDGANIDNDALFVRFDDSVIKSEVPIGALPEVIEETVMVPEVVTVNYLKEDGAQAWKEIWTFEWDEYGYPAQVTDKTMKPGDTYTVTFYNIDGIFYYYPRYGSMGKLNQYVAAIPGFRGYGWITAYGERLKGDKTIHTTVLTNFTPGFRSGYDEFKENPLAHRIYNDIPRDYTYEENEPHEWLFADYTYDEYGNPIRIDTYNLKEELCGYVEIEWKEIDIKS